MHLAFGSGECLTKTRVSEPARHGRPRTAGGLSGFLLRVTRGEGVDEAAVTDESASDCVTAMLRFSMIGGQSRGRVEGGRGRRLCRSQRSASAAGAGPTPR